MMSLPEFESVEDLIPFFQQLQIVHKKVTEIHKSFETVRELYNQDVNNLSEMDNSNSVLEIAAHDEHLLETIISSPILPIAVAGPNSSGKSTLMNHLLGGHVMPTGAGHVTARICQISYAQQSESKITFSRLKRIGNSDSYALVKRKKQSDISLAGATTRQLAAILKPLLSRDNKLDENEKEAWANTIVQVHYPFPLVQPGFDLYDLPGSSATDDAVYQNLIKIFLDTLKPMVMFVYANPAISDAELPFLRLLNERKLLESERGYEHRIFFCSNMFDADNFISDFGWDGQDQVQLEELVAEQELHRYELLYNQQMFTHVPKLMKDYPAFGCVSGRDAFNKKRKGQFITARFMKKLFAFVARANQSRISIAIQEMKTATEAYFTDAVKVNYKGVKELRAEAKQAQQQLKFFREKGENTITTLIQEIPSRLKDKMTSKKSEYINYITTLKTQWDNACLLVNSSSTQQYLEEQSCTWIKVNILESVFADFVNDVKEMLRKEIKEFLDQVRENQFIIEALNTVISPMEASTDLVQQITLGVSGLTSFVAAAVVFNLIPGLLVAFAGALGTFILVPMVLGGVALAFIDALRKVNDNWKARVAEDLYIQFLKTCDELKLEDTKAKTFFLGFIAALDQNVKKHIMRLEALSEVWDKWKEMAKGHRTQFGELYARLIAVRDEFYHLNIEPAKKQVKLASGGFGEVWQGEWNNTKVALKFPKHVDNPDIFALFYQEILICEMSNLKQLENVLRCHAIYNNPQWVLIFPLYDTDLSNYMFCHGSTTSVKDRLSIILSIAEGLVSLHSIGIIHRDLKLENILVKLDGTKIKELVIADLGIATPNSSPGTTIGTKNYMAMEMFFKGAIGYDKSVDILALGLMMLELLPAKLKRITLENRANIHDMLPRTVNLLPLYDLIQVCCSEVPEDRPSAGTLVSQIRNIISTMHDE